MKRSNLIVALGLAVFIVGAAATYLVLKDDGSSQAAPAAGPGTVLYADQAIPAGTGGSAALQQGLVKSKSAGSAAPPGALTDPSQLAGMTAATAIPEGSILTSDQFAKPQTSLGTLKIPEGKTALALQLEHLPGIAGFARAGDHVNIFGLIKEGAPTKAQLVMQNTEVLHISTPLATPGEPAAAGSIFLLAVTPVEAERLVYLTTFQSLYFSLVPRDQPPVPGTPGSGLPDALKQLS